jgi:hypothetical protein
LEKLQYHSKEFDMIDKQRLRKGKARFYSNYRLNTSLISRLEVFMYPSAEKRFMELIESIVLVGAGFGPTLMALQLLTRRAEKGIATGRRLGKLQESKTEMEVTL